LISSSARTSCKQNFSRPFRNRLKGFMLARTARHGSAPRTGERLARFFTKVPSTGASSGHFSSRTAGPYQSLSPFINCQPRNYISETKKGQSWCGVNDSPACFMIPCPCLSSWTSPNHETCPILEFRNHEMRHPFYLWIPSVRRFNLTADILSSLSICSDTHAFALRKKTLG
jgi:hypothetical protein